jgi:hypothetical protein
MMEIVDSGIDEQNQPPTARELQVLRDEIDPTRLNI